MDTQLDRHCIEVLHSKSVKDFLRKIVDFSHDRGFGRVSATVLAEHSPTLKEYRYIANAPTAYLPEFAGLWERQAPYGYRSGITPGFHLPRGRGRVSAHALMQFIQRQPVDTAMQERQRWTPN